jgi:Protein of unknown function (DUF3443)
MNPLGAHKFGYEHSQGGNVRSSLVILIVTAAVLSGCGGSGGGGGEPKSAIKVSLVPATGVSVVQGAQVKLQVNVQNDSAGAGVIWSLDGDGALIGDGALLPPTPWTATYVAPSTSIVNPNVVVSAASMTDPSAKSYIPISLVPQNTFGNVQPISVDGGPVAGTVYPNAAYTSIQVCPPGSISCQTIDGILVDTGSVGLRILSSALPGLPSITTADGNPLNECVKRPDQTFLWGSVVAADVRINGEVAQSLAIHALNAPSATAIPSECTDSGARTNAGTQQGLRANGILGVGFQPQDCGYFCDPTIVPIVDPTLPPVVIQPPPVAYFGCPSAACSKTNVSYVHQVTNPIVLFAKDNNGVAIHLPALSGSSTKLDGVMTFGIGTQINNPLGNATVFTLSPNGTFTSTLAPTGQSLTSSAINSGFDAFYFPDDSIPVCSGGNAFFCPPASMPVTSLQVGANGAQGTIKFSVENADTLFSSNPGAAAFSNLAGSSGNGPCAGDVGACTFNWGLPFFYGRTVFVAISGRTVPHGAPTAPWFAYTTGFNSNMAATR